MKITNSFKENFKNHIPNSTNIRFKKLTIDNDSFDAIVFDLPSRKDNHIGVYVK